MTDPSPPPVAQPHWIALKLLAGATVLLGIALLCWGALTGVVTLAQKAMVALGVLPQSAVYAPFQSSAELWWEGAMVLVVFMAVLAFVMAVVAVVQGLLALKAWLKLDSFID